MKRYSYILLAVVATSVCSAQQPPPMAGLSHKVPFASSSNTIELSIENGSTGVVSNIHVVVNNVPSWVHVANADMLLDPVKPHKERNAVFTFSVDKTAPVNKQQRITFIIKTPSGETWTKEIALSVAPPDKFELLQNYPNPFNPQTKIDYILPRGSRVKVIVYNVLGQEVRTLVNEAQDAGYKSVVFDGSNLPSGVYLYRVQMGDVVQGKSMLLLR